MTRPLLNRPTAAAPAWALRPASGGDVDAIAVLWHRGWCEVHLGHVPDGLARHRRPADLRRRVPAMLRSTIVAHDRSGVAGFVTWHDDEIEQLYVDGRARGSGAAAALLARGESAVARHHDRAWLAVVDPNTRARRFYERHGWRDAGPLEHLAWGPDGAPIPVPTRRYEKVVTSGAGR